MPDANTTVERSVNADPMLPRHWKSRRYPLVGQSDNERAWRTYPMKALPASETRESSRSYCFPSYQGMTSIRSESDPRPCPTRGQNNFVATKTCQPKASVCPQWGPPVWCVAAPPRFEDLYEPSYDLRGSNTVSRTY